MLQSSSNQSYMCVSLDSSWCTCYHFSARWLTATNNSPVQIGYGHNATANVLGKLQLSTTTAKLFVFKQFAKRSMYLYYLPIEVLLYSHHCQTQQAVLLHWKSFTQFPINHETFPSQTICNMVFSSLFVFRFLLQQLNNYCHYIHPQEPATFYLKN